MWHWEQENKVQSERNGWTKKDNERNVFNREIAAVFVLQVKRLIHMIWYFNLIAFIEGTNAHRCQQKTLLLHFCLFFLFEIFDLCRMFFFLFLFFYFLRLYYLAHLLTRSLQFIIILCFNRAILVDVVRRSIDADVQTIHSFFFPNLIIFHFFSCCVKFPLSSLFKSIYIYDFWFGVAFICTNHFGKVITLMP